MNPEDLLRELKDNDRWTNVRVPRAAPARQRATTRMAPGRMAQLVAAYAIAILAVIALVVGLGALRPATPPAAPIPSSSSAPSSAPTPTFTIVPGASHTYSANTMPPACTLAQMQTASKQDGGGAGGSYIQLVGVHNSGSDCALGLDAVRVGGNIAKIAVSTTLPGFVIPARASGNLIVDTASACQPSGTESNIDAAKPVLSIELQIGSASRTMTARFPKSRCIQPTVHASIDVTAAARFVSPLAGVDVSVDPPSSTPQGSLRYNVTLQNTGKTALVLSACPTATEVLEDGDGAVVTRALTLRCTPGTTLEPDVPITLPVSTTIPAKGSWSISWFLGGGSATAASSTTCTIAQLRASEPGPSGGATGLWVQLVELRNQSTACTLPATAFAIGGRVARAGQTKDAGGFNLPAGSTTRFAVEASTTCADGTMNIPSPNSLGSDAKPVTLQLGGKNASGLDEPFPRLYCAGPYVDRLK